MKTNKVPDLLKYIKQQGGTEDETGLILLPESLGKGYIQLVRPIPGLAVMLQQYKLKEELTIKRQPDQSRNHALIFSFRNVLMDTGNLRKHLNEISPFNTLPSVQVSSFHMGMNIFIPAEVTISSIIIGIDIDFLRHLLQKTKDTVLIRQILDVQQPYLYEEIISPAIQATANEIFQADPLNPLADFFLKLKSEELIYLFLQELLKREKITYYPINPTDIETLYRIKDHMITHINTAPKLEELADIAHMSVSKLGRLFRQIFGDSIYHYYQKIRMQEAAFLLREEKLSVSEVGYQLGFSNLSHFTRIFEKHLGIKPKKYSKTSVE